MKLIDTAKKRPSAKAVTSAAIALAALLAGIAAPAQVLAPKVGSLARVAQVDPRFQSYNLEMAEVIGARFWAPFSPPGAPQGEKYQERIPIDLKGNARLRHLAEALGPAYVRVSGTWANSVYFQDDDKPPLKEPPAGYSGILTRAQWRELIAWAKAVDARIVTSFAISQGARDPDGSWNPDQARRLLRYTREIGGRIYAIEPINEPNLGDRSALPKGYGPSDYRRDNQTFLSFLRKEAREIKFVGPSATGDAGNWLRKSGGAGGLLSTAALMSARPTPRFDIFSFHTYTSSSERCVPVQAAAKPEVALTEPWLEEVDRTTAVYEGLRDRFNPGAPIWVTEIGQASCGGDRWASTFFDTFRYVDNAARLARRGTAAFFHNTLAASDYGLIDDRTWEPRPSYWAAVLWRKLMGETVLDGGQLLPGLHVFAHCLRGRPGGVALIALNLDQSKPFSMSLAKRAERYTLSADVLQGTALRLNGKPLQLAGNRVPQLTPALTAPGLLTLAPKTITFLAVPTAANPSCR